MENREVSAYLKRIAELLILKGENEYKVRAYQQAARTISRLEERVEKLVAENRIQDIKGIGKALALKIGEITTTGKSRYMDELEAEVPVELLALFSVPGIGAKNVSLLLENLNVKTVKELVIAAERGEISRLPRVGPTLEKNILLNVEVVKRPGRQMLLSEALMMFEDLRSLMCGVGGIKSVRCAGQLRRGRETVREIIAVAGVSSTFRKSELTENLKSIGFITGAETLDGTIKLSTVHEVPIFVVTTEEADSAVRLFYDTGPRGHVLFMEEKARREGLLLTKDGLFKDGKSVCVEEEEDLYGHLDFPFIPPELREDNEGVFMAEKGVLPLLVAHEDIMGDLHLHSDWSDGFSSVPELVNNALSRGYKYIAITDHSGSLKIAGGLSVEKFREQVSYIRDLRRQIKDIHIFTGIEVDILRDGTLDYPDELLAEAEVVVASVHSGFNQDREQLTGRILSAIKNPHVNIIGHITGRLIGKRMPCELDLDSIFPRAAAAGTLLEINASPDRLDLRDDHIKKARSAGVRFAINTDAHGAGNMDDMAYGVINARRGALTRDDVVNTYRVDQLHRVLDVPGSYIKK